MSKIFTNKVNAIVNKSKLSNDFNLYFVKSLDSTNIFTHIYSDSVLTNNIESCCYMNNKQAYILTKKEDKIQYFKYNNNVEITNKNIAEMDDVILLNLILIICTNKKYNTNLEPISNIDGQCYLYMKSDKDKKMDEILTLNLRFHKQSDDIILQSELKTFTKFDFFPDYLQAKFSALPKFLFTKNNVFARTNEKENVYIRKSKQNIPKYKHTKNQINEFEFANEKFRCCRVFSYYKIYELLQNNKYIKHFEFIEEEFVDIPKLKKSDNLPRLVITPHILNIINTTGDKNITEKLCKLVDAYDCTAKGIVVKTKNFKEIDDDVNNRYLIILEDDKEKNDKFHHNPNIIKQCITKENVEKAYKTFSTKTHSITKVPQSIENALMELQVKSDLCKNEINLAPSATPYQHITAISVNIEENFYSMITIDNNGKIVEKNSRVELYNLENKYPKLWDICDPFNDSTNNKIKTFLMIDNSTYEMTDSNIKGLPNIAKISERLVPDEGINQTVSYFINDIIKDKINSSLKSISLARVQSLNAIETFFDGKENHVISAREFLEHIKNDCKIMDAKSEKSKKNAYADDVQNYLDNNHMLTYNFFGRNQNFLETIFGCYYLSGYQQSNNKLYFFMQPRNPKDPINNTIANANIIHCIQNINEIDCIPENHINILLWLLCVTFVKFNCYSTKPFLFKYLDEMERAENEKTERKGENNDT